MRRLTIGQRLQAGLLIVAVAALLVTTLGLASVLRARAGYDDATTRIGRLETASARVLAAGVIEEAALRSVPAASSRRAAGARFTAEGRLAASLASDDPASARLVGRRLALERQIRRVDRTPGGTRRLDRDVLLGRRLLAALDRRQAVRREQARHRTRHATRSALARVAVGGGLLVVGALALVALLAGTLRRPLEDLQDAGRRWAAGRLEERAPVQGPKELQDLAVVFNDMAGGLGAARDELESERQKLAVVVESLAEGLVVCDADGRVVLANPQARAMVPQAAPGAVAGEEDWPLPALQEALGAEAEVALGGRTLAVTAARLASGSGTVYVLRDVSERARLDRLKSEFIATASHELRTPLTSVKGYLELVVDAEGLTPDEQEFLDIAVRNTDRLAALVEDLLDAATIESGRLRLRRRPLDLAEVAREVTEVLAPRVREKEQAMVVVEAPGAPAAFADRDRIRQVVLNLATNAHLYTPAGGRVTLEVRARADAAVLAVRDSGRGMTPDEVQNIFERFYRGSAVNTESAGTGLGMGIVRSLLEAHGGTIDISSEPGVGSEFVIALPVAPAFVAPESRQAIDGRRILVIDDEVDIAELLEEQLGRLGAHVELAHSGEAALELLRSRSFDAVTLDQKLPGMSGLQVLTAIRADPALAALPVVIVSAYLASSPGGEPVVTKPIDVGALARAVALALAGGRPRALLAARNPVLDSVGPILSEAGVAWDPTGSAQDAAAAAAAGRFDLVLLDAGLPRAELLLDVLRERGPDTLLVVDAPDGAALRGAVHVTLTGLPGVLRDTFFVGSLRQGPAGGHQPEGEGETCDARS